MYSKLEDYHRKSSVLRLEQLLNPVIHSMVGSPLVRKPILHFIPDNDSQLGVEPRSNIALFFRNEENELSDVYVDHVNELARMNGFSWNQ